MAVTSRCGKPGELPMPPAPPIPLGKPPPGGREKSRQSFASHPDPPPPSPRTAFISQLRHRGAASHPNQPFSPPNPTCTATSTTTEGAQEPPQPLTKPFPLQSWSLADNKSTAEIINTPARQRQSPFCILKAKAASTLKPRRLFKVIFRLLPPPLHFKAPAADEAPPPQARGRVRILQDCTKTC